MKKVADQGREDNSSSGNRRAALMPANSCEPEEKDSFSDKGDATIMFETIKTPERKKSGTPQKKSVLKPVLIAAAAVLVVGGIVFAVIKFSKSSEKPFEMPFSPQIEVTMADGTSQSINANVAYAELMTDKFYQGTVIDGVDVGGMTKDEAYNAVMEELPEEPVKINVKLLLADKKLVPDFKDVTVEYNTREIIDAAYENFRPANDSDLPKLTECYNGMQQLRNENQVYDSTYTIQINNVREVVEKVLNIYKDEYSTVKNASIVEFDSDSHEFIIDKEKAGYAIDVDATVKAVEDLFASGVYEGTVTVPTVITEPEVTEEMINETFGLIGSEFTTTTNEDNRNTNIRQACDNINGTILEPGEVFSFNGVVGKRTYDSGFTSATVIAGGEYKQDLGGGICQVSSTLYNAALKSDLKIIERHPHAWPSSYISPGLDATVDWPSLDLKFENDTDYQIIIVTWWDPDDLSCNAEIYGKKLPDGKTIDTKAEIVSTSSPGDTEYVTDKSMAVGQTSELRPAHQGVSARAYKVWYDADGEEISRDYYNSSYYNAYARRVAVGVLNSDGTIASIDYSTGEIIEAEPSVTPSPSPSVSPTPGAATPTTAPATPTPEPATPTPEPATPTPEPATPTPEPATPTPEPEPDTPTPEPDPGQDPVEPDPPAQDQTDTPPQ